MQRRWTAAALLFALAAPACASGCGQSPPPPPEETPPPPGIDQPALPRCRLTAPNTAPPPPSERVESTADLHTRLVAGGPRGLRAFHNTYWWDDTTNRRRFELEPVAALTWTGAGYLVASGRNLDVYDRELAQRVARRALPARACDVDFVAPAGAAAGVLMVYFRPARGTCGEDAEGPAFVRRLTDAGVPQGPPVQLGRGAFERESAAHVSSIRVRLDAGRVVVTTRERRPSEDDGLEGGEGQYPRQAQHDDRFTVLSTDGRELAAGSGWLVACPRVGCVSFMGGPQLGVTVVGRASNAPLTIPLSAARIADLAVLGDRVLLRYAPGSIEGEDVPNRFALVDVVRRTVVQVFLEATRERVDSWREPELSPADAQITAAMGRFAILGSTTGGAPLYKVLDCGP